MVSVIVPVYKVEPYLDRCVRSILAQTYRDLEIILVDDGSPDRCGEMCDQYAALDGRVRVIHQNNAGQAAARNAGLEECHGEYVSFVDSDDEIDPRMISILESAIRQGAYDLAICGFKRFNPEEELRPFLLKTLETRELTSSEIWQEVFGRLNNAAWNKLYRREVIGELRFAAGLIHGEDLIFNLQYIAGCKKAVMTDAPLYHYCVRSGSITKSGFRENRFDEIDSKEMALELIQKYHPEEIENARKYCFRARMNVLRSVYCSGLEKDYASQIEECRDYVIEHYPETANSLRIKERAEFNLFKSAKPVYRYLIRILQKNGNNKSRK